jgi:protein associated with RNAse G/E
MDVSVNCEIITTVKVKVNGKTYGVRIWSNEPLLKTDTNIVAAYIAGDPLYESETASWFTSRDWDRWTAGGEFND